MPKVKRTVWAAAGILFVAALMACSAISSQEVRFNSMPGTDFSKYHSYKWIVNRSVGHYDCQK
jgi:hypothetical protein